MRIFAKFLVISTICILTSVTSATAEDPPPAPPSNSYVPTASEFSPRFQSVISNIVNAVQSKDTARLKEISAELLALDESNSTRADDDEKYFLSAYAKRKAGDLEGAVADFQSSIEYRQSNPHAHFLLAQTYADLAKCDQVFSELDQVRFLMGSEPAASYLLRGQCLAKLNRQSDAETLITAARKAFPADTQIKKLSLGFKAKAMAQGAVLSDAQAAELDGDLADLAQAHPEDTNIQLMYGKSLLKKGDILTKSVELDNAEKIARDQVEKTKYKNEISVKLLFDVLLKKRKHAEAKEVLNKGREQMPDSVILADSQRQLEIETVGLKVLKYDRR